MSSIENHTPLINLDSNKLINFYRHGFHSFRRDSYNWEPAFFQKLNALREKPENFEYKPKNNGARTLKNEVLESEDALFIIDYLFESGLIQKCMEVVGSPLYLTNYIFIECEGKTKSLPWHRDTYHYTEKKRVGLIPYNYKLLLSNDDLDADSPGTEVLGGSHNIDFNSRLFDLFWKTFNFNKKKFVGKAGEAIIFNGHALHRRPRTKRGKSRSAIIFGLAPVLWHQDHYTKNHSNVIRRFNEHLKKVKISSGEDA